MVTASHAQNSLGLVRYDDIPITPWRNGKGVTRIVAERLLGGVGPDAVWKVSLAQISDGVEFSDYPDVDRTLTLLDGGLSLTIDGRAEQLAPNDPFRFRGEARPGARTAGEKALVLNVMTRRSRMSATVRVLDLSQISTLAVAGSTVLIQLDGQSRAHSVTGEAGTLGRYDAIVPRSRVRIVEGDGTVAVVRMQNFRAYRAFA